MRAKGEALRSLPPTIEDFKKVPIMPTAIMSCWGALQNATTLALHQLAVTLYTIQYTSASQYRYGRLLSACPIFASTSERGDDSFGRSWWRNHNR